VCGKPASTSIATPSEAWGKITAAALPVKSLVHNQSAW